MMRYALALAAVLVLVAGKCGYDARRRAEGEMRLRLRAADSTIAALQTTARRVDTTYVRDTLRLWRTADRITTLIDTLRLSDTVTLTVRESVLVESASALYAQCSAAVLTCEHRVALRDSLIRSITWERDAWKRRAEPSFITRATTAAKWLAVGYVVRLAQERQ